jgi:spermidine synthase
MKNQRKIMLIGFITGMSITGMEISSSRLLAPYFGTSLFVWTNIVMVVMTALSIGYYVGGKLAERNSFDFLYKIITLAGLFCLSIPLLIFPLIKYLYLIQGFSTSAFIILGSLFFSIILFGLPLTLLGIVSPFLIKLATENREKIGDVSGKIFTLSTLGSIFGTFIPTFILIPNIGTRNTISAFAIILIILGQYNFYKKRYSIAVIAIILILFSPQGFSKLEKNIIAEKESVYQFIEVNKNNGVFYLSTDSGFGTQSIYNPISTTTGYYYDSFSILPYLIKTDKTIDVLIIGLAGGTIARGLNEEFGTKINMTGLEIDKNIIDLSKKYLGLENTPIDINITDGRIFLQSTKNKYDLIIVDAYQSEFHIPWTMTTKEFWQLNKNHLNEKGIIAINVNSPKPDSQILESITNTISFVFSNVVLTKATNSIGFNYLLIASNNKIDLNLIKQLKQKELNGTLSSLKENAKNIIFDDNKIVLNDDKAPIELLTDKALLKYFLYKN